MNTKFFYLGLPKSGSSSLYSYINCDKKGHEVNMNSVINIIYRCQLNHSYGALEKYLKMRAIVYGMRYDICTMFSLIPNEMVAIFPEGKFINLIRHPLDWSLSCLRHSQYIYLCGDGSYTSKYWSLVPTLMQPSQFIKLTTEKKDLLFQSLFNLLEYWIFATQQARLAMKKAEAISVKLASIQSYLHELSVFLENETIGSPAKFPFSNQAKSRALMEGYNCDIFQFLEQTIFPLLSKHEALDLYESLPEISQN